MPKAATVRAKKGFSFQRVTRRMSAAMEASAREMICQDWGAFMGGLASLCCGKPGTQGALEAGDREKSSGKPCAVGRQRVKGAQQNPGLYRGGVRE